MRNPVVVRPRAIDSAEFDVAAEIETADGKVTLTLPISDAGEWISLAFRSGAKSVKFADPTPN